MRREALWLLVLVIGVTVADIPPQIPPRTAAVSWMPNLAAYVAGLTTSIQEWARVTESTFTRHGYPHQKALGDNDIGVFTDYVQSDAGYLMLLTHGGVRTNGVGHMMVEFYATQAEAVDSLDSILALPRFSPLSGHIFVTEVAGGESRDTSHIHLTLTPFGMLELCLG